MPRTLVGVIMMTGTRVIAVIGLLAAAASGWIFFLTSRGGPGTRPLNEIALIELNQKLSRLSQQLDSASSAALESAISRHEIAQGETWSGSNDVPSTELLEAKLGELESLMRKIADTADQMAQRGTVAGTIHETWRDSQVTNWNAFSPLIDTFIRTSSEEAVLEQVFLMSVDEALRTFGRPTDIDTPGSVWSWEYRGLPGHEECVITFNFSLGRLAYVSVADFDG